MIPHVARNTGNNEHYTPGRFIRAARAVMGGIDLDPASSDAANERIRATVHYTVENDGLAHEWHGRVWMNPPYSHPEIRLFTAKLGAEFDAGRVTQAVTLTNNASDTRWFRELWCRASARCDTSGRPKFWHLDQDGNVEWGNTPLQGLTFIYMGPRARRFMLAFRRFGILSFQDGASLGPEPTVGQRALMASRLAPENDNGKRGQTWANNPDFCPLSEAAKIVKVSHRAAKMARRILRSPWARELEAAIESGW